MGYSVVAGLILLAVTIVTISNNVLLTNFCEVQKLVIAKPAMNWAQYQSIKDNTNRTESESAA